MRPRTFLMPSLLIAASLSTVSGCARPERIQPLFPPAADLRVEPKPVPTAAALGSEALMDAYEVELEAHGDRGWQAVGRLCCYFKRQGMDVDCPAG